MNDTKDTSHIEHSPNDFIIQGKESFALLFNIFNRTKRSQTIQEQQLSFLNNILTSQNNILQVQNNILKELKDAADEGEVMRLSGTVNTTIFTIINTITAPGHPVKTFELINDGVNSIYVGFNVVPTIEGADISDVTNITGRFDVVNITESVTYSYNRRKIRNIYLLASGGNSTYRLKLTW